MTENCPICNPKINDGDIIKDIRERLGEGYTPALDHALMHRAIREIERLRTNVRSMVGQLDHIGKAATCMVDSVKRNYKIDGGWEP